MAIAGRVLDQIILMIILGIMEVLKLLEFGEKHIMLQAFFHKGPSRSIQKVPVKVVRIIDAGTVLVAYIMALPVFLGHIYDDEECLQKGFHGNGRGIETDTYGFPVSRVSLLYLRISRIWRMTVGISCGGIEYSVKLSEGVLDAPETTSGKIQCATAVHIHFLVM